MPHVRAGRQPPALNGPARPDEPRRAAVRTPRLTARRGSRRLAAAFSPIQQSRSMARNGSTLPGFRGCRSRGSRSAWGPGRARLGDSASRGGGARDPPRTGAFWRRCLQPGGITVSDPLRAAEAIRRTHPRGRRQSCFRPVAGTGHRWPRWLGVPPSHLSLRLVGRLALEVKASVLVDARRARATVTPAQPEDDRDGGERRATEVAEELAEADPGSCTCQRAKLGAARDRGGCRARPPARGHLVGRGRPRGLTDPIRVNGREPLPTVSRSPTCCRRS